MATATRLDTDSLTANQQGRIMAEFGRLGFHPRADRTERLRLTAALAQSGPVGSVKDLTMGEAGRVIGALIPCRSVSELYAAAEPRREQRTFLFALRAWLAS